mmetsp:Transcript_57664/g.137172  ORF Transcript_57664/g.137172 Transcript_57664/m.137172 type:complete len:920 (+) Transcript_57664:114-2873(+)
MLLQPGVVPCVSSATVQNARDSLQSKAFTWSMAQPRVAGHTGLASSSASEVSGAEASALGQAAPWMAAAGVSYLVGRRAWKQSRLSGKKAKRQWKVAMKQAFEEAEHRVRQVGSTPTRKKRRIVMVGAGPGGLALACVLKALEDVEVTIIEARNVKNTARNSRSHTIGLGRRAREAILEIGGQKLWDTIRSRGMVAGGFTLHLNGVGIGLPAPEGEPVVLVDRGEITAAFRSYLSDLPCAEGTSLDIRHNTQVTAVDLAAHTVTVQPRDEGSHAETLQYDMLIGADGVRSRVREAMSSQLPQGSFESEMRVMPGRWQVLHMTLPDEFAADSVHAMVSSEAPFGLFCIPNSHGPHCVIVSWSSDETPKELVNAKTPAELEAVLLKYFPKLKAIPTEVAQEFIEEMPSKAVVSRCRPLHNVAAGVCVLGDAAHAVGGGSLGQGCSAALQDAAALAACLKEGEDLIMSLKAVQHGSTTPLTDEEASELRIVEEQTKASVLTAFSDRRAAEAWALLDLIDLQSASEVRAGALVQGPVVMAFFIEQLGRGTLRPLADVLSQQLSNRLVTNRLNSDDEIADFVSHLKMRPSTMNFSPRVLGFLHERVVLTTLKTIVDFLANVLKPPMQTALMATDESYSSLVERNMPWLDLLRSARDAAGLSRLPAVHEIKALRGLNEAELAEWAKSFTVETRLKDDLILRRSAKVDYFCAISAGECKVLENGREVAVLGPGDCFAEVALMLNVSSPVAVVASSDVTLMRMPASEFKRHVAELRPEVLEELLANGKTYGSDARILEAVQMSGRERARPLLNEAILAGALEAPQDLDVDALLDDSECELYGQGEVVALGCQRLRILQEGVCDVMRNGRQVRTLKEGDVFGPDLAPEDRVIARTLEVHTCSLPAEASASLAVKLLSKKRTSYQAIQA